MGETPPPDHWTAAYFGNTSLSGTPAVVQDGGTGSVDYDWGGGGPPAMPADGFSARFTRSVYFDPGRYRFSVTTDDGSRLYVDGQNVLDRWFDQGATTYTADVDLSAGPATAARRPPCCDRARSCTATFARATGCALSAESLSRTGSRRCRCGGRHPPRRGEKLRTVVGA